jgi:hypothetical protein
MPIIVIVLLLGAVQVADLLGYWQTSGQELVDLESFKASEIKGWMSLDQVAAGTNVPLSKLQELWGLPADMPGTTLMKDIEETIDVSAARTKLGEYLGEITPAAASGDPTATPQPAAATVEHTPKATPAASGTPKVEASRTPAPAGQLNPADIKGNMTLKEVSEGTGVPLAALLAEAKLPADTPPATPLKDLVTKIPGFEIQTLRDAATKLMGK